MRPSGLLYDVLLQCYITLNDSRCFIVIDTINVLICDGFLTFVAEGKVSVLN